MLERRADDLDDLIDRLTQRLGNLHLVELNFGRHAAPDIAPANVGGEADAVAGPYSRADLELDAFGGALTNQQIEVAPDIGGDGFVHAVAADPCRPAEREALEG